MTSPPVRRQRFEDDLEAAADHYLTEAGFDTAIRFVEEVEELVELLARHPDLGSNRHAEASGIPGLRSMGLSSFPYLVFFGRQDDGPVTFWRILHGHRDIPQTLRDL